ncbi:MAG: hypothetical protein LC792_00045 [Actinobacteria bacterium]|nr:hypothetical protein [Actinomycetota bacterium]
MSTETVTVVAVVACLGLARGDGPVTIAATPQVLGAIENGYLTRTDSPEPETPHTDAQDAGEQDQPSDPATDEPTEPAAEPAAVTGSGERKPRRTRASS